VPQHDTRTIAFGINVPSPVLGGPSVLRALRSSEGTALTISDAEAIRALRACAASEGLLCCPEGAMTIAAAAKLRERGWIADDDEVVLLNTGAGNKYPNALEVSLSPASRCEAQRRCGITLMPSPRPAR
jgi:threonine synthase